MAWTCAFLGCQADFEAVEDLLIHQARDHDGVTCKVCGERMPDGYPALRHMISDHTRAEYVRAYGASADEIRVREEITEYIAASADLETVAQRLKTD